MLQAVLAVHRHPEGLLLPGVTRHQAGGLQADDLLLPVLQHDIVVALDQVVTAAGEAAQGGHRIRTDLLLPRHARLPGQVHAEARVVLPLFTLAVLRAEGQQRKGGVVHPGRDGVGVTLAAVLPEQAHFITVVLLDGEGAPELGQRRKPGLGAQVPAVSGTLFIVGDVRGVAPVAQAGVGVGAELEEVAPVLAAEAETGVAAGEVAVVEEVRPGHLRVSEVAPAGAEVHLGAVVGAVQAALGEEQVAVPVVQGHEHVQLRVFQGKTIVHVELQAGGAEAAQPLLHFVTGRAGGHAARHRGGGVAVRAGGEEAAGPGGIAGHGLSLGVTVGRCRRPVITPGHGRQGREGDVELVARLQVIEAAGEGAELVEALQGGGGHVIGRGDGGDGLAGTEGVGPGPELRLRGVLKEASLAAGPGHGRGEDGGEGEGGLNADIKPGEQPDAHGKLIPI